MQNAPLKYNPGLLGDGQLVRNFVVRHQHLEIMLEAVKDNSGGESSNRHILVVGPRGIGKTMLVRRVAAEVRSNPIYSEWLPIVFGEESYQVCSAGEFWLEALTQLSGGQIDLDRTLAELRDETNDGRLRERALSLLRDFSDQSGKRLLIVVENLDMLCEQISHDHAWELRHTLASESRIMLLGTATSRFQAIENSGEAWFEFFSVHELKPLDAADCETLWSSVAGQHLKPGQIRAIRILTGGNPRLMTVLASFAANRSFRELMEDLIHLIDDHTEYFKSHLDGLAPKERKVFAGLLEHWNPVGAAALAQATRMGVNEVSSLLNRLVSRGAVELAEDRPRRKLYQAAERLYNIYYLMRRRGVPADRVRAAVGFMVIFYDGRELVTTIAELAREACELPKGETTDHYEAYAELLRRMPKDVWNQVLERTPPEFFERDDTPGVFRQLSGSLKLGALVSKATAAYWDERWPEAVKALGEALKMSPDDPNLWTMLGSAFAQSKFLDDAESAFRRAIALDSKFPKVWGSLALLLQGSGRHEEAVEAFRNALGQDPDDTSIWWCLGYSLMILNRHKEAIEAFRRVTEIDPTYKQAWKSLGIACRSDGDLRESERAFRQAIAINPRLATTWLELGATLKLSGRKLEAIKAFRKAIKLDPTLESAWSGLGLLLSEIGSHLEAEKVWTQALSKHQALMSGGCSYLLKARLARGVAPDVILREAEEWIDRAGRTEQVLISVAHFLLRSNMDAALPKAETWAREAVSRASDTFAVATVALAIAAQGRWIEAIDYFGPVLDAVGDFPDIMQLAINFMIHAGAYGFAREALDRIVASKGAMALEPLATGLKIFLGETPQVAKEILEIGADVADRIRRIAVRDNQQPDSAHQTGP